ncbi:MAG: GGDEF domain-containing protein, partial [Ktedonobacteraceae bacterium]|nr:GGDEF domain-containing protein [Ktedonobacteraceae bacterium]
MTHPHLHLARSFWYSAGLSLLYCLLLLSWLLLKPGSHALFLAGDNLGQTLGLLGAVLLCGVGQRRFRRERSAHGHPKPLEPTRQRAVPILLGLGIFCQFFGQAIYTYYEQLLHLFAPFPSWADAFFLSAYPFLLLGILLLPVRPLSVTARSRVFLDGLMITTALITCSWYFILGPTLLQGATDMLVKVLGVAYPFSDLVLACCVLLLTVRSSIPAVRPAMVLLSLAFVVIIATDSLFDYLTLQNAYATGGVIDLGWVMGYLLVGLAVQALCGMPSEHEVQGVAAEDSLAAHRAPADDPLLWRALVPYLLVPVVLLLGIYVWYVGGNDLLARGTYLGGAVLLALVLVRQVLAVRETHRLNRHLHGANTQLEALSTTDPLTQLANHRALLDCLEKEIGSARRYGQALSLLFFDGDHFKRVNDTYGHGVGDAVLQELGRRGRDSLRAGDTIGRYGGEEFMVLLPQTETAEAREVAERLRKAIVAYPLASELVEGGVPLTISMGVATFPTDGQTAGEVRDKADQAMYWAKRLGRNQIRTALEA